VRSERLDSLHKGGANNKTGISEVALKNAKERNCALWKRKSWCGRSPTFESHEGEEREVSGSNSVQRKTKEGCGEGLHHLRGKRTKHRQGQRIKRAWQCLGCVK